MSRFVSCFAVVALLVVAGWVHAESHLLRPALVSKSSPVSRDTLTLQDDVFFAAFDGNFEGDSNPALCTKWKTFWSKVANSNTSKLLFTITGDDTTTDAFAGPAFVNQVQQTLSSNVSQPIVYRQDNFTHIFCQCGDSYEYTVISSAFPTAPFCCQCLDNAMTVRPCIFNNPGGFNSTCGPQNFTVAVIAFVPPAPVTTTTTSSTFRTTKPFPPRTTRSPTPMPTSIFHPTPMPTPFLRPTPMPTPASTPTPMPPPPHHEQSGALELEGMQTPTTEQCAGYINFWDSAVVPAADATDVEISIGGNETEEVRFCDDASSVASLIGWAQSLQRGGEIPGTVYDLVCNNFTWTVCSCGIAGRETSVELTVGPVGQVSCCGCGSSSLDLFTVRPCIGNVNWGGINTLTCDAPSQEIFLNYVYNEDGQKVAATKTEATLPLISKFFPKKN